MTYDEALEIICENGKCHERLDGSLYSVRHRGKFFTARDTAELTKKLHKAFKD